MPDEKKEEFEKEEEIKVEVTPPVGQPDVEGTERDTPIVRYRYAPLTETHGMTTEANRFKET